MNPTLRTLLWIGAGLTLLATVAALLLLWWLVGAAHGNFDVRFNGEPLAWPDWSGWSSWRDGIHASDWSGVLAAAAAVAGGLLMLVAVPALFVLALLLGALFSALGMAGVLLALALMAALALSPVWLPVLVLWLALRKRPARAAAAAGRT